MSPSSTYVVSSNSTLSMEEMLLDIYITKVSERIKSLFEKAFHENGADFQADSKTRLLPGHSFREEFLREVERIAHEEGIELLCAVGGTAGNILVPQAKLSPNSKPVLFGTTAHDEYAGFKVGELIRNAAQETGILLLPSKPIEGFSGKSLVYAPHEEPDRKAAVNPGSYIDWLSASWRSWATAITELKAIDHGQHYDVLCLGTSAVKYGANAIDRLIQYAQNHYTNVFLSLPTSSEDIGKFRDFFREKVKEADCFLANDVELKAFFEKGKSEDVPFEELQKLLKLDKRPHNLRQREKCAFITLGEAGCAVITAQEVINVPAIVSDAPRAENATTNGCGDGATGGFLFAKYKLGMSNENAAKIGMAFAAAIYRQMETQLDDYETAVKKYTPELYDEFMERIEIYHCQFLPNEKISGLNGSKQGAIGVNGQKL